MDWFSAFNSAAVHFLLLLGGVLVRVTFLFALHSAVKKQKRVCMCIQYFALCVDGKSDTEFVSGKLNTKAFV